MSWSCTDRSVPLGKNWRNKPLVFLHEPHCQGLKRPGFHGGSNIGEWSHEEVRKVFA